MKEKFKLKVYTPPLFDTTENIEFNLPKELVELIFNNLEIDDIGGASKYLRSPIIQNGSLDKIQISIFEKQNDGRIVKRYRLTLENELPNLK